MSGSNASLRRKDATAGGGIDGATAVISEAEFVQEFDYGGRQSKTVAALRIVFDIEGFDKPWEQHYSVGPSDRWEVQDNGDSIKSMGKGAGLNSSSNAFRFFDAFETACEASEKNPDDYLGEGSVAPLRGLGVRLGNIDYETAGGDPKKLIVVTAVLDEPAKGKGKPTAPKTADVEGDLETVISELLEDTPTIKKGDLAQLVAQAAKKHPAVKAMTQLAFKEAWLGDENRPWEYDRKAGKLKKAA